MRRNPQLLHSQPTSNPHQSQIPTNNQQSMPNLANQFKSTQHNALLTNANHLNQNLVTTPKSKGKIHVSHNQHQNTQTHQLPTKEANKVHKSEQKQNEQHPQTSKHVKVGSKQKSNGKQTKNKEKLQKLWNLKNTSKAVVKQSEAKLQQVEHKMKENKIKQKQKSLVANLHPQQFGMGNANQTATTSRIKTPEKPQNNSHLNTDLRKSKTSKIKLNISRVQQESRLKVYATNIKDIQQSVVLSKKQQERLKVYFKHICERVYNFPKNNTFENVKNLFSTINLTEWMIFCKQLGITEKFKQINQGVKMLSIIFKKHEDPQRRVNLEGFMIAVKQVIYEMLKNQQGMQTKQDTYPEKLKQIMIHLCLDSKKSHIKKLKQMGVMCSLQSYAIPQPLIQKSSRSSKQNKKQERNTYKNIRKSATLAQSDLNQQRDIHSEQQKKLKVQNSSIIQQKSFPKLYKTNMERKQSQLMHKLAVTNINKVSPVEQIKKTLGKFTEDDKFLKEYLNRQQKVKDGIISRLDSSLKKQAYFKI